MPAHRAHAAGNGRRRILDLAPLELECMHGLWPLGEATVRQIREAVAERRPRAYTTIMTIMDRLARKGIVTRRRAGRAWVYRPEISVGEARARAVEQVVEHFFGGSAEALGAHLRGEVVAKSAGGAGSAGAGVRLSASTNSRSERASRETKPGVARAKPEAAPPAPKLDDTLL